jgi:hypothetical protein
MRRTLLAVTLASTCLAASSSAFADLCESVQDDKADKESYRDADLYTELFPSSAEHGSRDWNAMILECNRKRDTLGHEIAKVTQDTSDNSGKKTLHSDDLSTKVVRGKYNFFGLLAAQQKYVYALKKQKGVWTMVLPYKPVIEDLVKDRIDIDMGYKPVDADGKTIGANARTTAKAFKLYDASQITSASSGGKTIYTLKAGAQSIAGTLCNKPTYFAGKEGKYDKASDLDATKRDKENSAISLGKLQYRYTKDEIKDGDTTVAFDGIYEGCRVEATRDLYWKDASGVIQKTAAKDYILDEFVRATEEYWKTSQFTLKMWLKGRNDSSIPSDMRDALADNDFLTVRFATKFMAHHFNQMYKSNIVQYFNFSTMTSNETYRHEVGHAFGLDDEYGHNKKDDCEKAPFTAHGTSSYQQCSAGTSDKRTVYPYVAISRYITVQDACKADQDCKGSEYCDKGWATIGVNQCLTLKPDNETCDLIGGSHQCKSGQSKLGRCYTPKSVSAGGTCYNDDACKAGKCSAIDGAKGTCVCKEDSDCGSGKWCDAGIDFKLNECRAKLDKGDSCGKAGSMGNDHKCKSGQCSGFPKYECK